MNRKASHFPSLVSGAVFAFGLLTLLNAQNVTQEPSKPKLIQQVQETTAGMSVFEASIALDIKDNSPEGVSTEFPSEVKRLYCFCHIKGSDNESEIQHRWYWNDDLMASVSLPVKSQSWRTYSAKTIPSGFKGQWRVAIINSKDDSVLKMLSFTIN